MLVSSGSSLTALWECAAEQASCADSRAWKQEEQVMSRCQVPAHVSKNSDT